jgi:hypothetical protein
VLAVMPLGEISHKVHVPFAEPYRGDFLPRNHANLREEDWKCRDAVLSGEADAEAA